MMTNLLSIIKIKFAIKLDCVCQFWEALQDWGKPVNNFVSNNLLVIYQWRNMYTPAKKIVS